MTRIKIAKPAETTDVVVNVSMHMSDGRNPRDGFKPASVVKDEDGRPHAQPEKLGEPQPWVSVEVAGLTWGAPAADIACNDGKQFYGAVVARALQELGLTQVP